MSFKKVKNISRLQEFLDSNLKEKYLHYSIEEYLEDIKNEIMMNGSQLIVDYDYEIPNYKTRTGNTELIRFSYYLDTDEIHF